MRYEVLRGLQQIETRWKKDFAKICEKILAISFDAKRGGFAVSSTSVQGVDICMVRDTERYAVEVKTTHREEILLGLKDVGGLQKKEIQDGYARRLAALRIDRSGDWIVADASRLRPQSYTLERLKRDSDEVLQSIAREQFPIVVMELKSQLLRPRTGTPLTFLDMILAKEQQ